MKSIIEEGSSIAKAIENAWVKAGKPKDFSIKIFEESQKNFFGLTTRSAKVGIFYNDHPIQSEQKHRVAPKVHPKQTFQIKPIETKTEVKKKEKNPEEVQAIKSEQTIWTPEMLESIKDWLTEMFSIIHKHIEFTLEYEKFSLKVNFKQEIFEDKNREKQFFSSLSLLLFQMLRNTYKRPLKGFKILFTGP